MSEFEYSNLSSGESSDEEAVTPICIKNKKPDLNTLKVSRELQLYYSNLFIDSFTLIDLFVKGNKLTYNAFLEYFGSINFHQIYAKSKNDVKKIYVAPHHFITTTHDAFAVASKFLKSHSREARIGAVYLLFTLYRTQPLKTYLINIKMEPEDYHNTKELVDQCLRDGLFHPAYCFYDLDVKRKITITANTINPCLEANYPRAEVRKHLGRVADKYLQIEYEERKEFNPYDKLQLMEQQMRTELAYINKLSNSALGHKAASEYKPQLSKELAQINVPKKTNSIISDTPVWSKKMRYKNKQSIAFPGKNESVLKDMVINTESPNFAIQTINHQPKKKKRRKIGGNYMKKSSELSDLKIESDTSMVLPKLSGLINSDSLCSSTESEDNEDTEDKYGDMIWRLLEGEDNDELGESSKETEKQ